MTKTHTVQKKYRLCQRTLPLLHRVVLDIFYFEIPINAVPANGHQDGYGQGGAHGDRSSLVPDESLGPAFKGRLEVLAPVHEGLHLEQS